MKTKLLLGLLGAAGSIGLAGSMVSCSDNYNPATDTDGQFVISLNLDKEVVASANNRQTAPASRADAQTVSATDLALRLTSESGSFSREWAKASEFSAPETVPVGKYTLEASYGSLEDEGFEKPYYYGSSTMTVLENKTTAVSVTAQLANSMVRIEMSDMFRDYFASYSISLRSELNTEHPYAATEIRPIYLAPGQITTTINITKKNGTTATLEPKSFTAEPRHSYLLKFDVNGGNADDAVLTLTYDDMTAMEEVTVDLSDAILNAPAPHMNADGFTNGESWTVMQGQASAKTAKITAFAQAGIDGLVLTTSSAYLESQGWPKEIDLVGGDAAEIALMKNLGLRVIGTTKPDKMALVDFTELLANIGYLEGGNNTSTFQLQVRDRNSRVAEAPIGFSVESITTTLSVKKVYPLLEWDTTLALDIATNAASLDGLKINVKNERGTMEPADITSIEPVAGQEGVYHVVATVPSSATDLTVEVILGSLKTTVTVAHESSPYTLAAVENGVYGWQAAIDLNYIGGSAAPRRAARSAAQPENVAFEVSTDNGETWSAVTSTMLSTNRYLIKGLTAGTTYQVRATCDGSLSRILSITTESGSQLENSDMETWSRTDSDQKGTWPNDGVYWWRYYPAASADSGIWGTLNLLSTSYTGKRAHTAYCNFSGTHETTDAHSGSKAANIETVGWGGNSAVGSTSSSNPQHIAIGELYLGHYDANTQTPVYGYTFAHRPASVEFWYKYTAHNAADYGYAFVKVLDTNGNVIAEKDVNLSATSSYTKQVLDLTEVYPVPCQKAGSLQIGFKSSGNPEASTNRDWLSAPPFSNLSDGRFTGSSLYIDDIKLNY